jgi:ligand-binding sensor domain-containing protein
MARKISIGLLGWLISWASWLSAEDHPAQFEFRHIQEKDGLSFNFINCFLQDRDGFLWIGTPDGLNRYDGSLFAQFKHKRNESHSLLNNTVHDLCEDRQGNIWMAVDNGISRYDKKTGQFINITSVNTRTLGICNNILCDRHGDIWFTSYRIGLYRYNTRTGQIQYFPYDLAANPLTSFSYVSKNGLLEDPTRNGLWVADGQGLHYFQIDRQQFINHRNNPLRLPIFTNHYVSALALDGDRLVFADNDEKKIIIYSLAKQQILKTITPVSRQPNRNVFDVATIFVDWKHNLWTSSWNLLVFHIAANTYQVTELVHNEAKPTSIAANFFWAGWQHPDGSVWLGTVNGISHTNPERSFYWVHDIQALYPPVIDQEGITRLMEDQDGSWWLGTDIRGLLHYNPQTAKLAVYKLPDASAQVPYSGYITAIVPYANTLFIGTDRGFSQFDKRTRRAQKIPLPASWQRSGKNESAFPVRINEGVLYDNQIWLGNDAGQVFSYNPQTGQWRNYPIRNLAHRSRISTEKLLVDAANNLWVHILPEGFARFDRQEAQFVMEKSVDHPDLTPNVAREMTAGDFDKQGNIWLAANGYGLWRYNPHKKTYENWTETEGLAYDHSLAALPDSFGHVWVGAYNKYSIYSPTTNQFLNITLPYSVTNPNYRNHFIQLRNGHILSAMKGHLVEFSPNRLGNRIDFPQRVLISRLDIGDSIHLIHSDLPEITLKSDETSFAVHFAALTSEVQTPVDYLYQLDGYEDWKRVDDPSYAIYTKLPGGDYTFRVKAVAPDGRQTPVSKLAIHVDTYLYQTTWFRGLILLIVLGLIGGFLRYRADQTERLHDLQVQASRLQRDKTEIQYQNLINHLNPHFLFNSLTSLNSLININPREASSFLRKLSIIYRYILQNKDKELVTLGDELTFVQNYIDLQKSRFDDALQITVDVPEEYRPRMIVPVTIQNLLENAIKHNVLDEESPLVIRIYPEGQYLCVVNNLQKKSFVETSNKQGLASLKSMYHYLSHREIDVAETDTHFIVKIPLL